MAEFHCCMFRDGIVSRNGVQESMHLVKCWLEERCKWQFVKPSLCGPAVRSVCSCSIKEKTCQISKPNYQKSKSGPGCGEVHRREGWPTMQCLVIKKHFINPNGLLTLALLRRAAYRRWSSLSCWYLTLCTQREKQKINKHLSFKRDSNCSVTKTLLKAVAFLLFAY